MFRLISTNTRYSLQKRLVLVFGILLILFIGFAGWVLDRAFQESVAASVEERLQLQIYALIGVAEPDDGGFYVPQLEEPRFAQIDSGLYAFILAGGREEVWRSPSALNILLTDLDLGAVNVEPGQTLFGRADNIEQGPLSYAVYGTYWESQGREYSFVVLESIAPTEAEIREFRSNLWFWLGALAVLLSAAQMYLLRWGMEPLQQLADDLREIEAGRKDQLSENYPSELQSVSENLNLLIKKERQRQSRYRTTLDDLAHSLKTPLAVISGMVQDIGKKREAGQEDVADIAEQVARMNQIISYQLKRAVKSEHGRVLAKPVPVAPVVRKVLAALNKVYMEKSVRVRADLEEGAVFFGEESDLTELLGNLLDNAFKYCGSQIAVKMEQKNTNLILEIRDDGKGIAEEDRQWVLERGARADTVESGQGIGMAVALDIVSGYGGDLKVGRSDLGGALIQVQLKQD